MADVKVALKLQVTGLHVDFKVFIRIRSPEFLSDLVSHLSGRLVSGVLEECARVKPYVRCLQALY